ncbi:MAG: hypothetical protein ACR2FQ_12625 [Pseudonocardiaceae bacterium]
MLVVADSPAFHGPERPEPADEPRLWPNVAAAALGGRAELVAGFGWSARDAWWALTRDPRVWALLPRIDALVLGVGSIDTLPSPLPTPLRERLRYVRPDGRGNPDGLHWGWAGHAAVGATVAQEVTALLARRG